MGANYAWISAALRTQVGIPSLQLQDKEADAMKDQIVDRLIQFTVVNSDTDYNMAIK